MNILGFLLLRTGLIASINVDFLVLPLDRWSPNIDSCCSDDAIPVESTVKSFCSQTYTFANQTSL